MDSNENIRKVLRVASCNDTLVIIMLRIASCNSHRNKDVQFSYSFFGSPCHTLSKVTSMSFMFSYIQNSKNENVAMCLILLLVGTLTAFSEATSSKWMTSLDGTENKLQVKHGPVNYIATKMRVHQEVYSS